MILVSMKRVKVEINVIHHADAPEPVPHVPGLSPQHRLIQIIRIVWHKFHRVALTKRVFECLTSDLVDQRKCRVAFFILYFTAIPHVLDPVLVSIIWIGWCKNYSIITNGQIVPLIGAAEDLDRWLGRVAMARAMTDRKRVDRWWSTGFFVRYDLPALVIALAPVPQYNGGPVVDPTVVLVSMEGVKVQKDVVHHADAAESLAHVLGLGPQH